MTVQYQLQLDDSLMHEAVELGKHGTEADAVQAALKEYVRRKKLQAVIDLFGTIDYYDDYDYKAARRKNHVCLD